jgi:uncharacterized membrane protein
MPFTLMVSLVLALGFFNGLRTLTPVAVLCWALHFHWISLTHTPFAFLANIISLIVFTVLAIGELIGDKLPKTPSRLSAPGMIGRIVFGAGVGAALLFAAGAPSGTPWIAGLGLGAIGAVVGAYVGYSVRRMLTHRAKLPDFPIALLEDLIAIGGSFFVISRF